MISLNRTSSNPDRPIFLPGQIVRHRRYGYRGVVVDCDEFCHADEEWYQKNQTQPVRDQPWYHVLVDGTTTCTYAASENLIADDCKMSVSHPLIPHFFTAFEDGVYVRNDEPWPG